MSERYLSHLSSVCNGVRNCKGGWDEEGCGPEGSAIPLDFTAAHVMLTRSRQWTSIRAWGLRIAKRSSLKKAKIAVARKLAVVMHRMWRDDAPFHWGAAA